MLNFIYKILYKKINWKQNIIFSYTRIYFHENYFSFIMSNICLCEQDKIKFLFMFIYYIE